MPRQAMRSCDSSRMSVSVRIGTTFSVQWEPPERLRRDSFDCRPQRWPAFEPGLHPRPAPVPRGGCEANGCPGRARCPFEHPGDVTIEPLARLDGSLEEPPAGHRGVEVQVIPGGAAFETSIDM